MLSNEEIEQRFKAIEDVFYVKVEVMVINIK